MLSGSPADFRKLIAEDTEKWAKRLIHTGVAAMESLANWIDAKPYRFTLILLAHTAVVGAILAATGRF